jgi:hypothetical protein
MTPANSDSEDESLLPSSEFKKNLRNGKGFDRVVDVR